MESFFSTLLTQKVAEKLNKKAVPSHHAQKNIKQNQHFTKCMKLNTCLLACAVRVSLRRAFKRTCLYFMSYTRLRSRFNIRRVCLCFAAQGRCGKPRSQELKHPGATGLGSEESQESLAPAELLSIFHGRSPVFHRKHTHYCTSDVLARNSQLQPCGGSPSTRKNS